MSDAPNATPRPAAASTTQPGGAPSDRRALRTDPGDRPHHGQHHRRRDLQPADVARRVRADHVGLDGSHHHRCARAGRAVRRAVAPPARRRRPLRVRQGRVRQQGRLRQRVVVLDHGVGRQRGDRRRLGAVRRAVRQQGPQPTRVDPAGARRSVAARGDQPVRGEEHGHRCRWVRRSSSSPRSRSCRRSACSTSSTANYSPVERERRERDRRDRWRHGDRTVQLPRRRDRVGGRGEGPRPGSQHPAGHDPRHAGDGGRLHALAHRGVRHPAELAR